VVLFLFRSVLCYISLVILDQSENGRKNHAMHDLFILAGPCAILSCQYP
jgi:hypothetical protein